MAFTGRLGSGSSQLGNIILGFSDSPEAVLESFESAVALTSTFFPTQGQATPLVHGRGPLAVRLPISRRHPWIGSPPPQGQAALPVRYRALRISQGSRPSISGLLFQSLPSRDRIAASFGSSITITSDMAVGGVGDFFSSSFIIASIFDGETPVDAAIFDSGGLTGGLQVLGM